MLTMLYKWPGAHAIDGDAFDFITTTDVPAALAAGWHLTMQQARAAAQVVQPAPPIPSDDAPPTRAELEHKARELGIKFDGRTGDKKLSALIEAKLGG